MHSYQRRPSFTLMQIFVSAEERKIFVGQFKPITIRLEIRQSFLTLGVIKNSKGRIKMCYRISLNESFLRIR